MPTCWIRAIVLMLASAVSVAAQTLSPEVTCWIQNLNGATGYNGLPSNVQKVEYSANWVYASCTCIPGYDIGPWAGNPNQPANQNFVFKITRTPQQNSGLLTATPLGHIGVWTNGVSIFNAKDARSYQNQGLWNQNAIVVEGSSFDDCLGHPAPNGEYHHHLNPTCLYDDRDSSRHSPIIGYAFDGFPIYGAFGYRNSDGSGGITRIRSSHRLRDITARTTKPDGTALEANQYGPAIGGQYPLGYYCEDFEYVVGLGELDEHNGRFCITPEYPQGTYAYFVTLDEQGKAAYPYVLGLTYYGIVPAGNTGPQSGHNTPTEAVTQYQPTVTGVERTQSVAVNILPNPATASVTVQVPDENNPWRLVIYDWMGKEVIVKEHLGSGKQHRIQLDELSRGSYVIMLSSPTGTQLAEPLIVQ